MRVKVQQITYLNQYKIQYYCNVYDHVTRFSDLPRGWNNPIAYEIHWFPQSANQMSQTTKFIVLHIYVYPGGQSHLMDTNCKQPPLEKAWWYGAWTIMDQLNGDFGETANQSDRMIQV